jgi:uncharacterized protein (DUF1499 family)
MAFQDWFGKNIYVTSPLDRDPFFHPRRYSLSKGEVIKRVQETLGSLKDWRVEEYRENQGRIRASCSSLFPPSAQDINIYVVEGLDGVTKLEMTSQSRGGGKADFGRNKRNLKEFLVRMDSRFGS